MPDHPDAPDPEGDDGNHPARDQTGRDRRQRVQSAEIGFQVLLALAENGPERGLAALAARLGMAGAKLHRYLQSLIATGLAEQDAATGRYRLGPAALRVGLAALGRIDVAAAAAPHLVALRDRLGHTCFLSVPALAGPTVVRIEQPLHAITVQIRLGAALSPRRSATGRAAAAFAGHPDLEPDLQAVRRDGVAAVVDALQPGVAALSAPIPGHDGNLAALVTLLGPTGSFSTDPADEPAQALRDTARAISHAIGGSPD